MFAFVLVSKYVCFSSECVIFVTRNSCPCFAAGVKIVSELFTKVSSCIQKNLLI
ncbi:hypothetical protein RchiOBHm_Chr5g0039301 [Rosa chinensis]|uniref:Uncharacterized protein n=1 Tax=Rosa chinensis TaxID=74649 RepID=A0A2P6QC77_ROSCH|nr:hypothetical protein RchiOBHm_Chr5g0039301 [Rosa chinensis]